jgi:2-keto-3-deoxy-L-rhamnonate aldolase RhmA
MGERIQSLRARLTGQAPLIGTFVKTPAPLICELLAHARLDLLCLDAEHAPFGRAELDGCLAALHAADQPALVRVCADSAAEIRNALDCGATGVLVPHVCTAQQAAAIVQATRYGEGGRGYSGSTRAAGFGTRSMQTHLQDSRATTTVIVQIEDPVALGAAGAIAAVDGVDAIFIGRADLAVAMGKEPNGTEVTEATRAVCAAARKAGTAVGLYCGDPAEIPRWREAGVTLFLVGSDQDLVLSGARRLATGFAAHGGGR